ncbi:MAG: hypothetical protein SFY69_13365 [Planctomycetota bacterium]|nr:hypothetical protein [Planctomycetota bacterium]
MENANPTPDPVTPLPERTRRWLSEQQRSLDELARLDDTRAALRELVRDLRARLLRAERAVSVHSNPSARV